MDDDDLVLSLLVALDYDESQVAGLIAQLFPHMSKGGEKLGEAQAKGQAKGFSANFKAIRDAMDREIKAGRARMGKAGEEDGKARAQGEAKGYTAGQRALLNKQEAELRKAENRQNASYATRAANRARDTIKQIYELGRITQAEKAEQDKRARTHETRNAKALNADLTTNMGIREQAKRTTDALNKQGQIRVQNNAKNNALIVQAQKATDTAIRQSTARANQAADRANARRNTVQRQGTTLGQVGVDDNRIVGQKALAEQRRVQTQIASQSRAADAQAVADIKRRNALIISAEQQAGVRRTAIIRTILNNLTRANQTGMTLIVNAWRSHQAKVLETQRSGNRREEAELTASLSRREARIRNSTRAQATAIVQEQTRSERAMQQTSTGVLGVASGRGMALGGLLAGGLGARKIFDTLGEYQSIQTAFKGIFREVEGGAPRTEQFLKDMQEFARETPFSLNQVALAAQKMFANRIVDADDVDATEQLTDRLRRLADAAAATGKTAAQMDMALLGITQIGSSGQFMMEELRQITENIGLPMEEVAKSLGMTVAQMRKDMKDGAIGATEGLDAVFDALTRIPGAAGASARQAKTLRGAFAQLQDVGEQLIIRFLMPVGNAFAGAALAIGNMGDMLLSGQGAWKVARDALGGIVGALTGIIAAKGAIQVIKLLGLALGAAVSAPVISGFVVLAGVLSTFDGVRATLAAFVEGTKNWFLVGYRANTVIDSFSNLVKIQSGIGKMARTIQTFTTALVVGTKDWFLVGYRISGVIDEFSNIVLFQTSLGAAARVIKDALGGIWEAVSGLARTGDFEAFFDALRDVASNAGKALSPLKDAIAEQLLLGLNKAKTAALNVVKDVLGYVTENFESLIKPGAGVGATALLKIFGLRGGLRKIVGASIVGAIGFGLISAIKEWDTGPAELSFGGRVGVIVANGLNAAKDLQSKVGEFFGGLFTENAVKTDPGKIGRSIRDFIGAALEKGGGLVEIVTRFFGRIGEALGKALDSGAFASFLVELPRKIGRKIAEVGFSEEFLKAVAGLGAGLVAVAVVVVGQFIRGFLEGFWSQRQEILKTIGDILNLGFSGGLATDIATRFVQVFVGALIAAKAWGGISGLLKKVFSPVRQFSIGLGAASVGEARTSLFKLRKEAEGTGSKAADAGMAVSKAFGFAKTATDGAATAARDFRNVMGKAGATGLTSIGPQGAGGKALAWGTRSLKHYADGWVKTAAVVSSSARKIADTASFAVDVARARLPKPSAAGTAEPSRVGNLARALDPRQFAPVQAALGRLSAGVDTFRMGLKLAFGRDTSRGVIATLRGLASEGTTTSKVAGRMASAFTTSVNAVGKAKQANSDYWAKYRGDATKGQQAVSNAMSLGSAAFSGYMLAMSNSAAETGLSVLASAGTIGQAFASGGPILGLLAVASTALGAWWGQREKEAAKAAAEVKARADEIAAATSAMTSSITATFEESGSSGAGARAAAVYAVFRDSVAESGDALKDLSAEFGVSIHEMALLAEQGGGAIADLRKDLASGVVSRVLEGDTATLSKFTDEVKAAQSATGMWGDVSKSTMLDIVNIDTGSVANSMKAVTDAFDDFAKGGQNVDELRAELVDLGLSAASADDLIQGFTDSLSSGLADTAALQSLEALSGAMDKAISDFKISQDLTGILRTKMEALGTVGDRMVSTWDRIKGALDRATGAYNSWIDATRGGERTEAEARIALDDLYKRRQELLAPPAEGEAATDPQRVADELLLNDLAAQEAVASTIANISKAIRQAGGGIDEVRAAVAKWFDDAIAGEGDQAGKDWLEEVKQQVLSGGAVEIQFETRPAVEGIADIKTEFADFINEAKRNQIRVAIENAPDFEAKRRIIGEQLRELGKDPVVDVAIEKAGGYAAVRDAILADKDIIASGVGVPVKIEWERITGADGLPSFDFNAIQTEAVGEALPAISIRPALADGSGPSLQRELDDIIANNPLKIKVEAELTGPPGWRNQPQGIRGPNGGGGGEGGQTPDGPGITVKPIDPRSIITYRSTLDGLGKRFGATLNIAVEDSAEEAIAQYNMAFGAIGGSVGAEIGQGIDSALYPRTLEVTIVPIVQQIKSIFAGFAGSVGGAFGIKSNWRGGLETSPTLSTLAERGAEAIFPLTNPVRMRQIMGIPQVASAFESAGIGGHGPQEVAKYAPVTVDQSQVNTYEIHESSPRLTADEIFRRNRKARFHGGHTLPVVVR